MPIADIPYGRRNIPSDGTRSSSERWLKLECVGARALAPEDLHMDTTTLLIILVLILLLGGGGWYGRGRWY